MIEESRRSFLQKTTAGAGIISGLNIAGVASVFSGVINPDAGKDELEMLSTRLSRISPGHPSLHFSSQDLMSLREKCTGSHKKYAEILFNWVDGKHDWSPRDFPYPEGREVALEQCGAFVTNSALAFLLSNRNEYLELTRRWVNEMYEYPVEDANNYGFGIFAAGLARVYDWLHDSLTGNERIRLREHIADITGKTYRGGLTGTPGAHWWANWNLHHDHWIPVGGYGEAALALLGDVPGAALWAATAKLDFDYSLSWLGDDGAWHEGAADWCYTLAPLLWFYGAWQSVTGENLHGHPWIRNTTMYRLYHYLPGGAYINLNDSFRSGRYNTSGSASCHLLRRLASLFGDRHAQWLAEKDEAFDLKTGPKGVYQAPYENFSFAGKPVEYPYADSQCAAWNVLWYDPEVEPKPPDTLPPARHFKNQGIVIMRTGWEENSAGISFACAPLAGHIYAKARRIGGTNLPTGHTHAQADYTSFTLFANETYLIVPPGYARRSSWFQNVIQVNGMDFLADPSIDVRIIAFRQERDFIYAAADASAAFPKEAGVESYRRHMLLFENEWLILFDSLALNAAGRNGRSYNRFTWSAHSEPENTELRISGTQAEWRKITDKKKLLTMYLLEPVEAAWERGIYQSTDNKPILETLRIVKPEWYSPDMQMLTTFSWGEEHQRPETVKNDNILALAWNESGRRRAAGFALTPGLSAAEYGRDLEHCSLVLFGTDPRMPDKYLRIE